jgi:hypothetical protein
VVCERNASEGAEGPRCAVCVYDITWCTAESSSSVYTSVLLAVAVAARPPRRRFALGRVYAWQA